MVAPLQRCLAVSLTEPGATRRGMSRRTTNVPREVRRIERSFPPREIDNDTLRGQGLRVFQPAPRIVEV